MARGVDRDSFREDEYGEFARRVKSQLAALRALLARPGFGLGQRCLGAECELDLIDSHGRPLRRNREVLAQGLDRRFALELDAFNLEVNCTPVPASGAPFSALEAELTEVLALLDRAAAREGGRIASIGILPTATLGDLQRDALTDMPRYRALANGLRRWRQGPFHIHIDGPDPLDALADDITLEGANTSFQLHLVAPPSEFAATYNAAQLVTPLAVAVGANSPVLCGHRLWAETRVALFKQALDYRDAEAMRRHLPARVSYGYGWVRDGVWELFAEGASLYPPLIPRLADEDEDAMAAVRAGRAPALAELRLHQGTVWRWNRAIYDPSGGGHLRIELRALPSGPTPIDMVASAAFLIGLTVGFRDQVAELLPTMPFVYCQENFYRAAQAGLDAPLLWPQAHAPSPRETPAWEIIARHVRTAERGLQRLGVQQSDIDRYLGVIRGRLETGTTGAAWQRRALARLGHGRPTPAALREMLDGYLARAATGAPVHTWD